MSEQFPLRLHWFCFTSLCDCSIKLASLSLPIRCYTKTSRNLVTCVFPRLSGLLVLTLRSHWLFVRISFLWLAVAIALVLVLRTKSKSALTWKFCSANSATVHFWKKPYREHPVSSVKVEIKKSCSKFFGSSFHSLLPAEKVESFRTLWRYNIKSIF